MSRCRPWQYASVLGALFLAARAGALPASATDGTAAAARETLILAATVDGRTTDDPVRAERVGAELWIDAADLRRIGVDVGGRAGPVALGGLSGLRYTVNDADQSIDIRLVARHPTHLSLRQVATPDDRPTATGWGAVFNYDLTGFTAGGQRSLGGTVEATAFTPSGYAFAGAIASVGARGTSRVERTDTGYNITMPGRLMGATVGDFINGASSFSRPIRMAGLRIGTDFSLRPDLVTFPLPTVSGTAAVPTAVDVIVNGDRQTAGDVRAGRFAVSDVPVQTGLNTISVATHDALGRPVVQTVTTYASRNLLRPGLSDFSAEVGWVRAGYLTPDDRYRQLAASGSFRIGATDRLTLEGHGEATSDVASGGAGASVSLGRIGLATVSGAISRQSGGVQGFQLSAGLERVAHPISLSARYTASSRNWGDIASHYGALTYRHSLVLSIGFDLARFGTLGASLIGLGHGSSRYDPYGRRLDRPASPTGPSTLFNATYSLKLTPRLGLVANAGLDMVRHHSSFAAIGILAQLGRRGSAYAGLTQQDGHVGATVDVVQSPIEQGQWGYRASATSAPVRAGTAAVEYRGSDGYAEAVVSTVGGQVNAQLSARGSIGIAAGHPFLSDTMNGSFAVIDTVGQAHVPVYQDNRRIGQTDSHGFLVAPNLAAFEPTKFAIDPVDIDTAMRIGQTEAIVRPGRRSGVLVNFGLATETERLFTLVDSAGRELPPGSRATQGALDLPVGLGGALFAPVSDKPGRFLVRTPLGRTCQARLPARAPGDTPDGGRIVCQDISLALN